MSAPARPADVVEALVERSHIEGRLSMDQLRMAFDDAGIGPAEARGVLRQLSEQGAVLGSDEKAAPRARRSTSAARPTKRTAGPQETRPAGRTVTSGISIETAEEPAVTTAPALTVDTVDTTLETPAAVKAAPRSRAKAPAKPAAAPAAVRFGWF